MTHCIVIKEENFIHPFVSRLQFSRRNDRTLAKHFHKGEKMSKTNQLHRTSFIIIAFTFFIGASTYAAESGSRITIPNSNTANSSQGTTQTELKTDTGKISDFVYLNYFATYHGPNLTKFDSPYTTDSSGKVSKQAMYLDSEINADYLINKNTGIGPVIPFFLYTTLGQGASLGDVGLKIFNRKTLSTSDFTLNTNIIFQLPTNDASSARGMKFAVKTTPNVRYAIPNSRFTLGSWTEAKAYLGVEKGKTFKLWAGPYVNYQLTSSLSLNLEYELEGNHLVNAKTFDFTMVQNDFMPGFIYMITPKIMVNPYVQIFTGKTIAFASDRMALGALLSATL